MLFRTKVRALRCLWRNVIFCSSLFCSLPTGFTCLPHFQFVIHWVWNKYLEQSKPNQHHSLVIPDLGGGTATTPTVLRKSLQLKCFCNNVPYLGHFCTTVAVWMFYNFKLPMKTTAKVVLLLVTFRLSVTYFVLLFPPFYRICKRTSLKMYG